MRRWFESTRGHQKRCRPAVSPAGLSRSSASRLLGALAYLGAGGTNTAFFSSVFALMVGTHDWTAAPGASPMNSAAPSDASCCWAAATPPVTWEASDPPSTSGASAAEAPGTCGTLGAPGTPGTFGTPGTPGACGARGAPGTGGAPAPSLPSPCVVVGGLKHMTFILSLSVWRVSRQTFLPGKRRRRSRRSPMSPAGSCPRRARCRTGRQASRPPPD